MSKEEFFVGIGAQRAGTTWLGKYFANHPEVGFSPIKELHYFDAVYRSDMCEGFNNHFFQRLKREVNNLNRNFSHKSIESIKCLSLRLEMIYDELKYKELFDLIAKKEHFIVGEITPAYSLLNSDAFAAIKRLYKKAKFIFLMRDPVDRFWSNLRLEEKRFNGTFDAKKNLEKSLSNPQMLLRTNYKRTLTELYSAVPSEDIYVAFYENLMDPVQHQYEMPKLTDFLGINFMKSDIEKRVNKSPSIELSEEQVQQIALKFFDVYKYVAEKYEKELPRKWQTRLFNLGLA